MSKNIYLTQEELDSFTINHKTIGEGTEGICFRHGNEIYKIYKNKSVREHPSVKPEYDKDGVRIFKVEEIRKSINPPKRRVLDYTNEEGVLLNNEQALEKAIERGHKIVKTKLPQKIIYINGIARGCVYPFYKYTSSIYKALRKTYKKRLQICRLLIEKTKELIDNNIYPIDLCQKGPDKLFDKRYANVLLNYKNEPLIIDLDGKSALYTEVANPDFEKRTCTTLSNLIYEIMTREDIQEDYNDEDFDTIREYLSSYGLTEDIIYKFLDCELTMEDIDKSMEIFESRIK